MNLQRVFLSRSEQKNLCANYQTRFQQTRHAFVSFAIKQAQADVIWLPDSTWTTQGKMNESGETASHCAESPLRKTTSCWKLTVESEHRVTQVETIDADEITARLPEQVIVSVRHFSQMGSKLRCGGGCDRALSRKVPRHTDPPAEVSCFACRL